MNTLLKIANSTPAKWAYGAFVLILTIYAGFFYERRPDLVFEIISNSNVLDVRESLSKLAIIYDGRSLKAQNQNLYLLTVRIANRGTADILKNHFDDSEPLGFQISTGAILEPPSIVADEYLKRNTKALVKDARTVTFSPVILNSGDYFDVKTLLLVTGTEPPLVLPLGKIAGVRAIRVTELFRDSTNRRYIDEAFGGRMLVQLGRLGGYLVASLILLIVLGFAIGLPATAISATLQKKRRLKLASKYREAANRNLSTKEEYLLDRYVEGSWAYDVFAGIVTGKQPHRLVMTTGDEQFKGALNSSFEDAYKNLESAGLITRDGPQISVNPDSEAQARELVNFIESSMGEKNPRPS